MAFPSSATDDAMDDSHQHPPAHAYELSNDHPSSPPNKLIDERSDDNSEPAITTHSTSNSYEQNMDMGTGDEHDGGEEDDQDEDEEDDYAVPTRPLPTPTRLFFPDMRLPPPATKHWEAFPTIRVCFVLRQELPPLPPTGSSSSATTTTTTTTALSPTIASFSTLDLTGSNSSSPPPTSTNQTPAAPPAGPKPLAVLSKPYHATIPYKNQASWSLSDIADLPERLRLVPRGARRSPRRRVDVWHLGSLQLLDSDGDVRGVLTAGAAVPGFVLWLRERGDGSARAASGRADAEEAEEWDERDWAERDEWRSLLGRVVWSEEGVPGERMAAREVRTGSMEF